MSFNIKFNHDLNKNYGLSDGIRDIYSNHVNPSSLDASYSVRNILLDTFPNIDKRTALRDAPKLIEAYTGYKLDTQSAWKEFGQTFLAQKSNLDVSMKFSEAFMLAGGGADSQAFLKKKSEAMQALSEMKLPYRNDFKDMSVFTDLMVESGRLAPSQLSSIAIYAGGAALAGATGGASLIAAKGAGAIYSGMMEAGGLAMELSKLEENGQKLDDDLIYSAWLLTMAGVGALNLVTDKFEKVTGGLMAKLFSKQNVKSLVKSGAIKTWAGGLLKSYGQNIASESVEEALEELIGMAASNYATSKSNTDRGTEFKQHEMDDMVKAMAETALSTAKGMILGNLPTGAIGAINDYRSNDITIKRDANKFSAFSEESYAVGIDKFSLASMEKVPEKFTKFDAPVDVIQIGNKYKTLDPLDAGKINKVKSKGAKALNINIVNIEGEVNGEAFKMAEVQASRTNAVAIENNVVFATKEEAATEARKLAISTDKLVGFTENEDGSTTVAIQNNEGRPVAITYRAKNEGEVLVEKPSVDKPFNNKKTATSERLERITKPDAPAQPLASLSKKTFNAEFKKINETRGDLAYIERNIVQKTSDTMMESNPGMTKVQADEIGRATGYFAKLVSNIVGKSSQEYFGKDFTSDLITMISPQVDASIRKSKAWRESVKIDRKLTGNRDTSVDRDVATRPMNAVIMKDEGGKRTIYLGKDANPVTVMHELSHAMVESIQDTEVFIPFKELYASELKSDGGKVGRAFQERFAADFELYVKEGKAENEAIRTVFQKITDAIKDMVRYMNRSLDDNTRKAFDSLLNTGLQAAHADVKATKVNSTGKKLTMPTRENPVVSEQGNDLSSKDATESIVEPNSEKTAEEMVVETEQAPLQTQEEIAQQSVELTPTEVIGNLLTSEQEPDMKAEKIAEVVEKAKEEVLKVDKDGQIRLFSPGEKNALENRELSETEYKNMEEQITSIIENEIGENGHAALFSVGEELLATHNMKPEVLSKLLRLKSIPMPSLAISRMKNFNNQYGSVMFILKPNVVTEAIKKGWLYDGDMWSPTMPYLYQPITPGIDLLQTLVREFHEENYPTQEMVANKSGRNPLKLAGTQFEAAELRGITDSITKYKGVEYLYMDNDAIVKELKDNALVKQIFWKEKGLPLVRRKQSFKNGFLMFPDHDAMDAKYESHDAEFVKWVKSMASDIVDSDRAMIDLNEGGLDARDKRNFENIELAELNAENILRNMVEKQPYLGQDADVDKITSKKMMREHMKKRFGKIISEYAYQEAKPKRLMDFSEVAVAFIPKNEIGKNISQADIEELIGHGIEVIIYNSDKTTLDQAVFDSANQFEMQTDIEELYASVGSPQVDKTIERQATNANLKEETRVALENNEYPSDQILNKYKGEKWADKELQYRRILNQDTALRESFVDAYEMLQDELSNKEVKDENSRLLELLNEKLAEQGISLEEEAGNASAFVERMKWLVSFENATVADRKFLNKIKDIDSLVEIAQDLTVGVDIGEDSNIPSVIFRLAGKGKASHKKTITHAMNVLRRNAREFRRMLLEQYEDTQQLSYEYAIEGTEIETGQRTIITTNDSVKSLLSDKKLDPTIKSLIRKNLATGKVLETYIEASKVKVEEMARLLGETYTTHEKLMEKYKLLQDSNKMNYEEKRRFERLLETSSRLNDALTAQAIMTKLVREQAKLKKPSESTDASMMNSVTVAYGILKKAEDNLRDFAQEFVDKNLVPSMLPEQLHKYFTEDDAGIHVVKPLADFSISEMEMLNNDLKEIRTEARDVLEKRRKDRAKRLAPVLSAYLKSAYGIEANTFTEARKAFKEVKADAAPKGTFDSVSSSQKHKGKAWMDSMFLTPSRLVKTVDHNGALYDWFFGAEGLDTITNAERLAMQKRYDGAIAKQESLGIKNTDLIKNRVTASKTGGEQTLTLDEAIGVYVYNKQEDGQRLLLAIDGNNFTEANIKTIVDSLSDNEKAWGDFLISDMVGSFGRLSDAYLVAKNKSLGFTKNYFPLLRGGASADFQVSLDEEQFARNKTPEDGNLKERTQGTYSLALNATSIWNRMVKQQEHYVAASLWSEDTQFMLRKTGGDMYDAIAMSKGSTYASSIQDFVNRFSNNQSVVDSADTMVNAVRNNLIIARLGFNLLTSMKQLPSLMHFAREFGPLRLMDSIYHVVFDHKNTMDFIYKKAPALRDRSFSTDYSAIANMQGKNTYERTLKTVGEYGMMPIKFMDKIAVATLWHGSYNAKIANGMEAGQAAKESSRFIGETQPGGGLIDTAAIYAKKDPFWKFLLMFSNQLNKNYNIIAADIPLAMKDGMYKDAIASAVGLGLSMAGIVLVSGGVIRDPADDDDEYVKQLMKQGIGQLITQVPVLGKDLSNIFLDQFYSENGMPMMPEIDMMYRAVVSENAERIQDRAVKLGLAAMELTGAPTGLGSKVNNVRKKSIEEGELNLGFILNNAWGKYFSE